MAKAQKKFPQTIFVGRERGYSGLEEDEFVCETDESEFAFIGEKRRYAVYQYVETREIEVTATSKKVEK